MKRFVRDELKPVALLTTVTIAIVAVTNANGGAAFLIMAGLGVLMLLRERFQDGRSGG